MTITLWQLVTVILVMMGSVAGLLKYVFYLLGQHKDHINSKFVELEGRFDDHKDKFEQHGLAIQVNNELLHKTREEYVKNTRLDKDFKEVIDKFDQVFSYLTGLSRDLNRLIGSHNNRIETSNNDGQ